MGNYDFNGKFPVGEYVQAIQRRAQLEQVERQQNQQNMVSGINAISTAFQGIAEKRRMKEQSQAQADVLTGQYPEIVNALGGGQQVASRTVPMPEGMQGPAAQVPVTVGQTGSGRAGIVDTLAKSIYGTGGDNFLNKIAPAAESDLQKQYKLAQIAKLGKPPSPKAQLRQNAFTGDWEWYEPPTGTAPGSVTPPSNSSGGGSSAAPGLGTFRDRSKAAAETAESNSSIDGIINQLNEAKQTNKGSRGGFIGGLTQKAQSASNYKTDTDKAFKDTAKTINILRTQVAAALKSTFPGAISNSEREYLEKLYGAAEKLSPAEREIAINEVITMMTNKKKSSNAKFSALTGSTSARGSSSGSSSSKAIADMSDDELRALAEGR